MKEDKRVLKYILRALVIFVSTACCGIGVGMLRMAAMGTDPFSAMNYGVASIFKGLFVAWPKLTENFFSIWSISFNCLTLILVLIFGRKYLGIGTLINMVFSSIFSDLFVYKIMKYTDVAQSYSLPARIGFLIGGVFVLCVAVAFYMACDEGMSPYDCIAYMITDWTKGKIAFRWTRIMTDVMCVLVAFGSGMITGIWWQVIGVGTIIMAFGTGPFVAFVRKHWAEEGLLKNILKQPKEEK